MGRSVQSFLVLVLSGLLMPSAWAQNCNYVCRNATAAKKGQCLKKCEEKAAEGRVKEKGPGRAEKRCMDCTGQPDAKKCCDKLPGCKATKMGSTYSCDLNTEKSSGNLLQLAKDALQALKSTAWACGAGIWDGLVNTVPKALSALRALVDSLKDPGKAIAKVVSTAKAAVQAAGRCVEKIRQKIQDFFRGAGGGGNKMELVNKAVTMVCSAAGKWLLSCALTGCGASLTFVADAIKNLATVEGILEKADQLQSVCN
jgi:hypothetical protein